MHWIRATVLSITKFSQPLNPLTCITRSLFNPLTLVTPHLSSSLLDYQLAPLCQWQTAWLCLWSQLPDSLCQPRANQSPSLSSHFTHASLTSSSSPFSPFTFLRSSIPNYKLICSTNFSHHELLIPIQLDWHHGLTDSFFWFTMLSHFCLSLLNTHAVNFQFSTSCGRLSMLLVSFQGHVKCRHIVPHRYFWRIKSQK